MSVLFQPDRYGVQVISKYTSQTGRWIIFLGAHYNGTERCWDVGTYRTHMGACQRLHFKSDKVGAEIKYDEIKEHLKALKQHEEPEERFQIFGPDGKHTQ